MRSLTLVTPQMSQIIGLTLLWKSVIFIFVFDKVYMVSTSINEDASIKELSTCEDGWKFYDLYCYKKDNRELNWKNASDMCRMMGGNLTSIHSKEQDEFLEDLTKETAMKFWWIGLRAQDLDRNFAWVDGTDVNYTHWGSWGTKGNYGSGNCVTIYFGKWFVRPCSKKLSFLCQKYATVTEYTTTEVDNETTTVTEFTTTEVDNETGTVTKFTTSEVDNETTTVTEYTTTEINNEIVESGFITATTTFHLNPLSTITFAEIEKGTTIENATPTAENDGVTTFESALTSKDFVTKFRKETATSITENDSRTTITSTVIGNGTTSENAIKTTEINKETTTATTEILNGNTHGVPITTSETDNGSRFGIPITTSETDYGNTYGIPITTSEIDNGNTIEIGVSTTEVNNASSFISITTFVIPVVIIIIMLMALMVGIFYYTRSWLKEKRYKISDVLVITNLKLVNEPSTEYIIESNDYKMKDISTAL